MKIEQLRAALEEGHPNGLFAELYGNDIEEQLHRYRRLLDQTIERFAHDELRIFSTPGRTELGGNHTDHNGGKVLAASVHLDSIAMVEPSDDREVLLYSDGYPDPFRVDLAHLDRDPAEEGHTEALIRGVAAYLVAHGYRIGGFRGSVTSDVLPGSGLSSSASIEVLLGTIFNGLYNGGTITPTLLSIAGQFAENTYFGKPCGLMDQLACATGGIVAIDFERDGDPKIQQVTTTFADHGYSLVVVDTGGSHADLTPDYAAVPAEMRSVAAFFGKEQCREITREQLLADLPALREAVGDRAILRALHFFADNERVDRQIAALAGDDFAAYLEAVRLSGDSSWELLQNNYSPSDLREQGVALAIALSRLFLGEQGAVRIQGGGFAGTMQAYPRVADETAYRTYMEGFFGAGRATPIRVRNLGTTELFAKQA